MTEVKKITRIIQTVRAPKPKIPEIQSAKNTKIPHVLTEKALRKSIERPLKPN
jgi:hypothetical protein